jgi:hypothetical protein
LENFIYGLIAPFLDPKKGMDDAPDILKYFDNDPYTFSPVCSSIVGDFMASGQDCVKI